MVVPVTGLSPVCRIPSLYIDVACLKYGIMDVSYDMHGEVNPGQDTEKRNETFYSLFLWVEKDLYVVYRNKVGPKNLKGFFSASYENVCMVWWIFAVNPVLDRIASRRAKPHSAQA